MFKDGCMESTLFVVVLVGLIAWLIIRPSRAKRKGKRGEEAAAWYLRRLPSEYVVMSDVMLPTKYGSTQIDHVVISPYGVFVIEVKNMIGNISGHEKSENWTQNIYGNRYEIRNPIKQNQAHIFALKEVFNGLKKMPYFSIIAFGSEADLYVGIETADVVRINKIVAKIREYNVEYVDGEEVKKYGAALVAANITDKESRANHVANVRQHVRDREISIANLVCPRCGGQLVERQGKYGRFYGCSNYPRCTFTHQW